MTRSVHAQDAALTDPVHADTIHVESPAEPLAEALQDYSRKSGLLVMADAALLRTRISAPVSGDFSAQDALQRLLAGTGLDARFTSANSAVILPSIEPQHTSTPLSPSELIAASMIDGGGEAASYALVIQARLTEALCESPQTRPGNYRLAVQLRIDGSGSVTASKLLSSTGDAARDTAIADAVRELVLDYGPPASLPQPVTILLRPQATGVTSGCASSDQRG